MKQYEPLTRKDQQPVRYLIVDDYSALLADFVVRDVAALPLGLLPVLHAASEKMTR